MIVKRFGCTAIHNKELYKCLIHSFKCLIHTSHLNVLTPFRWYSFTSSMYLDLFLSLASSIRSSQGTVSSKRMICLEASEISTMSGLSDVIATVSGNLSCLPRSTFRSQSCADVSMPEEVVLIDVVTFSQTLTKVMVFFDERKHFHWVIPLEMVFRTLS